MAEKVAPEREKVASKTAPSATTTATPAKKPAGGPVPGDNSVAKAALAAKAPERETSWFDGLGPTLDTTVGETAVTKAKVPTKPDGTATPDAGPGAGAKKPDPEAAPDPVKQPVKYAEHKLAKAREKLDALKKQADSGDPKARETYYAALRQHSSDLADLMAALPREKQAEFMKGGASKAVQHLLKEGNGFKSGDTYQAIVGNLMQMGEQMGSKNVRLLSETMMARQDPALLQALTTNMKGGKGSLLAHDMAKLAKDDPGGKYAQIWYGRNIAERWGNRIGEAQSEVNGRFRDTRKRVDTLNRQMLAGAAKLKSLGYPQSRVTAFMQEFQARHKADYDAFHKAGDAYGASLQGIQHSGDHDGLDQARHLNRVKGAERYSAEALMRKGRGEKTWLDTAMENADEKGKKDLRKVAVRGALMGTAGLTALRSSAGVKEVLKGLSGVMGDKEFSGVIDNVIGELTKLEQGGADLSDKKKLAMAMKQAFDTAGKGQKLPEELQLVYSRLKVSAVMGATAAKDGTTRAEQWLGAGSVTLGLTEKIGDARARILTKDPTATWKPGARIGAVGSGIGLVQSVMTATRTGRAEDIAKSVLSGADVAATIGQMAGKEGKMLAGLAKGLARRMPLLNGLMSAWETTDALISGDYEKAAMASLPLLGAGIGAGVGAFFGGVGAGPGAVIGMMIGGAIQIATDLFTETDQEKGDELAWAFIGKDLKKRGFSDEEVGRLKVKLKRGRGEEQQFFRKLDLLSREMTKQGNPTTSDDLLKRFVERRQFGQADNGWLDSMLRGMRVDAKGGVDPERLARSGKSANHRVDWLRRMEEFRRQRKAG